jgi:photosystem II stability/assembly factor-like uncharacterized protein
MAFTWQAQPIKSGEIANVVISPTDPNVMYAGVEVNAHSAYKSVDGGRSWSRIHAFDHTKDVAVHPRDPQTVLIADSQGIWRPTTAEERASGEGEFIRTFESGAMAGPNASSFSSVAFSPSNPDVVYASIPGDEFGATGGFLFRSEDGGQTFENLDGRYPNLFVVFVDPQNEDRVYAGSVDGIHISEDGGLTFQHVAPPRDVVDIHTADGTSVFAATTQGVWRSTDSGRTWREQSEGLPSKRVLRVRQVQDAPETAWATTISGVARSDDGGSTWTDVSADLPARNLQALAVHPTQPNTAFVATEAFTFSVRSPHLHSTGQFYGQGLFRTDNGGQTWVHSDEGLVEDQLIEITAHPTRPHEAWAMQQSSRGVYRTRDAGQTWSLSPQLLTHYPMRFAIFPGYPDAAALTSSHTMQAFGITRDSGVTWAIASEQVFFDAIDRGGHLLDSAQLGRGGAHIHIHGLAIDPNDPNVIYLGSVHDESPFNSNPLKGAHIFKSIDGGQTWE